MEKKFQKYLDKFSTKYFWDFCLSFAISSKGSANEHGEREIVKIRQKGPKSQKDVFCLTSLYKQKIRDELRDIRNSLSPSRRAAASKKLSTSFCDPSYHYCLSFFSFQSEISTHCLNGKWAKEGRLLLPRIEGKEIKIYLVSHYEQLVINHLGIGEPDPLLCKEITEEKIELVLVPGLGFDKAGYRIGYGKGFYDRFLPKVPRALQVGVGFKEQLYEPLPREDHDFPLSKVLLF